MSIAEIELDMGESFFRLGKDLKQAARGLTRRDARWLVDFYYTIQDERIRSASQLRTSKEEAEPHKLIEWVFGSMNKFESSIKSALGEYARTYAVGQWLQSIVGIGPVLSAALLTNFDIRKARTVGHFWRFAGLDPTLVWKKGEKRPYNAQLKCICVFKCGESFVKTQNHPRSVYGKLLIERKKSIAEKNAAGEFASVAAAEMEAKPKMKETQRYGHWSEGRIAPAHVHDRARRWAVKLFLSHVHHVMYRDYYGENPPHPYIFDHPELGDHRHYLEPPEFEGFEGRSLQEMFLGEPMNYEPMKKKLRSDEE